MLASELTVEQVKAELQSLIDAEPNNTGWASVDSDFPDAGCVYFLNEDGTPVSPSQVEMWENKAPQLVTPVCLIGRWVHDFHREFMNLPEFQQVFMENRSLGSSFPEELSFTEDVFRLLANAQGIQDMEGITWANINLDVCDEWDTNRTRMDVL